MRRIKKILFILMQCFVILTVSIADAGAADFVSGDYIWHIEEIDCVPSAVLTGYVPEEIDEANTILEIPDNFDGYPFGAIECSFTDLDYYEYYLGVDVIIPEGVKQIRKYSMSDDVVRTINIPATVCLIEPSSLPELGCSKIIIANDNPYYRVENDNTVTSKDGKKLVCYPVVELLEKPIWISGKYEVIGSRTIMSSGCDSPDFVGFEEGVRRLEDNALIDCAKELFFPATLEYIGKDQGWWACEKMVFAGALPEMVLTPEAFPIPDECIIFAGAEGELTLSRAEYAALIKYEYQQNCTENGEALIFSSKLSGEELLGELKRAEEEFPLEDPGFEIALYEMYDAIYSDTEASAEGKTDSDLDSGSDNVREHSQSSTGSAIGTEYSDEPGQMGTTEKPDTSDNAAASGEPSGRKSTQPIIIVTVCLAIAATLLIMGRRNIYEQK